MKIINEDEGFPLTYADAPWLGSHALILRTRAIEAMEPLLSACGEILPLICNDAQIAVFNPTPLEHALDESACSILRFSDGSIMHIERYVFFPEAVEGVGAFKISNMRISPTFVGDAFVTRWKRAGLLGLDFTLIWTSHPR